MSVKRAAIHDAYRRTTYRAALDGERVEIRIGAKTPRLDAQLRARGASAWAFISASNPHATLLSDCENAARHPELVLALEGYTCFEGEGAGDDTVWQPERSLLVVGISEVAALEIARDFAQEAIVVAALDEPARLVFCD